MSKRDAAVCRVTVVMALAFAGAAPLAAQTVLANGYEVGTPGALDAVLDELGESQIAVVAGDGDANPEAILAAGREVILALNREGFDVFVLPIGFYEGLWLDRALNEPIPDSLATWPIYRVWQESPEFRQLLEAIHSVRRAGGRLAVAGVLSRYHAIGKSLYAPHLTEALDGAGAPLPARLATAVNSTWGGRERLSRASPEVRVRALRLAMPVLGHLDEKRDAFVAAWGAERFEFERQCVVNMRTFVELEQLRAGDVPADDDFARLEQTQNFEWFLHTGFPGRRLIVWEGRGASESPVPAGSHRIALELRE
ncbi:MAG: hypothetical protein GKS06_08985 [Acidobacteria bacterium]|nr:hypothetical protein [Acidobacteriota bacterium]